MSLHTNVDRVGPSSTQVVVFLLEGQRYGLRLETTEHVLPAVELTPLPNSPQIVLGIFSLRGRIVPVVDIRRRFQLPRRAISPDQQLIVARTSARRVALLVDATLGVSEFRASEISSASTILGELSYLQGVARTSEGLVLIHDLDTFLSLKEAGDLDAAVAASGQAAAQS